MPADWYTLATETTCAQTLEASSQKRLAAAGRFFHALVHGGIPILPAPLDSLGVAQLVDAAVSWQTLAAYLAIRMVRYGCEVGREPLEHFWMEVAKRAGPAFGDRLAGWLGPRRKVSTKATKRRND